MNSFLFILALLFLDFSIPIDAYLLTTKTKISEDLLPYIRLNDEEFSKYLETKQKNGESIVKFLQDNGAVCDIKYHKNCKLYFIYQGNGFRNIYKGQDIVNIKYFLTKEISIKNEGMLRNRSVKVSTIESDVMKITIPSNEKLVRCIIHGDYNKRLIPVKESTQAIKKFLIENNYKIIEK